VSAFVSGHERIDRRSLAMHRAIAEKLRANPELMAIARENLARRLETPGHSHPYWEAWNEIFDLPLSNMLELIVEDSERMTAMRQTSPFAGILTPKERWVIYDRYGRHTQQPR
jgi:hypothetical protein